MSDVAGDPVPPAPASRLRPPAPSLAELAGLGIVGAVVGHALALVALLTLSPTPGRPDSIVAVVVTLGAALVAETLAGPAVAGVLARRREQGRGGTGSRRTFLEGALSGLSVMAASLAVLHWMGSIG